MPAFFSQRIQAAAKYPTMPVRNNDDPTLAIALGLDAHKRRADDIRYLVHACSPISVLANLPLVGYISGAKPVNVALLKLVDRKGCGPSRATDVS